MNVRIAKNSGFCFGVKRAIRIALEASETNSEIVTLGSIIHNPQMVEKLNKKEIYRVDSIEEIKGRPTLIRSHGIKKTELEELKKKNIEIIDATCPYVYKAQQYASKLSDEGYPVIILGDESHPEVIAIRSYISGENYVVVDPLKIPAKRFKKVAVISQTTRSIEDLKKLIQALLPMCIELRIINTICSATSVRQEASLKLAQESDLMIVIGGKKSSNTKMLAKISAQFIETHHIETEKELSLKWLKNKENIGITAGASTPDWIIVNVYNKILKCLGNENKMVNNVKAIPGFKEDQNVV
ncbi:MAG: 4-hydroxy-3-methylbut-2-enyl diphosphate reductase [Candidatus Cloacimonetes bacterium]|nr:4-hydroxy-3-methylbut-2-enyl diphosphate reductase [Candidatus Cloacimonadota bacterium]